MLGLQKYWRNNFFKFFVFDALSPKPFHHRYFVILQVVTGNTSNVNRGVTMLDSTSRAGTQLTSSIKPTTSQQQQAILTQVDYLPLSKSGYLKIFGL